MPNSEGRKKEGTRKGKAKVLFEAPFSSRVLRNAYENYLIMSEAVPSSNHEVGGQSVIVKTQIVIDCRLGLGLQFQCVQHYSSKSKGSRALGS